MNTSDQDKSPTPRGTSPKTARFVIQLSGAFAGARDAALAADPGPEADGGTCNFDTVAFRVPRRNRQTIEAAAELARVRVSSFTWFSGQTWYWLQVPMHGQANRRTTMMEGALAVMKAARDEIPGLEVMGYYQAD